MTLIAIFSVVLLISASLAMVGIRLAVNQKKIDTLFLWRLGWASIIICITLLMGGRLGKFAQSYIGDFSNWLSAIVFFALGVKTIYNTITRNTASQLISPFHLKGFWLLLLLIIINAFIGGIGLGLLNATGYLLFLNSLFIIFAAYLGYFAGFKVKKFSSAKLGIIAGIIYILLAVLIINN